MVQQHVDRHAGDRDVHPDRPRDAREAAVARHPPAQCEHDVGDGEHRDRHSEHHVGEEQDQVADLRGAFGVILSPMSHKYCLIIRCLFLRLYTDRGPPGQCQGYKYRTQQVNR